MLCCSRRPPPPPSPPLLLPLKWFSRASQEECTRGRGSVVLREKIARSAENGYINQALSLSLSEILDESRASLPWTRDARASRESRQRTRLPSLCRTPFPSLSLSSQILAGVFELCSRCEEPEPGSLSLSLSLSCSPLAGPERETRAGQETWPPRERREGDEERRCE